MSHRRWGTRERLIIGLRNGGPRTVRFTPNDYRHSDLAAQLIDSLDTLAEAQSLRANTVAAYAVAIRSFLAYLDEHAPNNRLSLVTGSLELSDHLYGWSDHMRVLYPAGSGAPRKYANYIYKLVRTSERVGVTVAPETLSHAQARFIATTTGELDRPLTEFSNAERIQLRDASRQLIRGMDQRLEIGAALLRPTSVRDHADPLGTALKELMQSGFGRVNVSALVQGTEIPPWIASVPGGGRTGLGSWWGRIVLSLVSPTADEYTAFRTLLLLEKGWAPEELNELRMDELHVTPTGISYTRHKARSHRSWNQFVESTGGSRWGFNALIERLIESTRFIRKFADPVTSNRLWIAPSLRGYDVSIRAVDFHDKRFIFSAWVQRHGLELSMPYDPRRLRKTYKTIRAIKAGTLAGAAGDDHSVAVYARHYLPGDALHTMAASTVRNVQREIVGPLRQFAAVYPYTAAQVSKDTSFPEEIRSLAVKETNSTDADRALLPVTCRDELSPPGTQGGGLCRSMVVSCMTCTNAVVFEDHVPRLVHLESTIMAHRASLPPDQFHRDYGHLLEVLQTALAKMPAALVQASRGRNDSPLELPLSIKAAGMQ